MLQRAMLLLGPVAGLLVGALMLRSGWEAAGAWTAGVTTLTALWWVFEPIPIPATSLIPIAVLPLVGVLKADAVGAAYGDKLILLMLGGFLLSSAMERSGAHRRIALKMVTLMGGTSGQRLVFGFMATSALLSMWISNTATVLMLLPIVLAVVEKAKSPQLTTALLLGVAYAASIGGIGTPVGTPPNLIFMSNYTATTGIEITFRQWMLWTLPVVVVMVPLTALWLTRNLRHRESIELPSVGAWRPEEVRTLLVFAATALLWVTRKEPFGGWSGLLNLPGANDASVALLAVVALFVIPNGRGSRLLDWETASKIPWGVLLLFSGGIVIAKAFASSGLSESLGDALASWGHLHPFLLIGATCLSITFLTEVTSNTATANLLLPVLAVAAVALGAEPKVLMVPATISASFAFMLPAATGPNAVIFSSQKLTVRTMAREGFVLNLLGAVVVTCLCYFMFG